jgi:hypothetical protein
LVQVPSASQIKTLTGRTCGQDRCNSMGILVVSQILGLFFFFFFLALYTEVKKMLMNLVVDKCWNFSMPRYG